MTNTLADLVRLSKEALSDFDFPIFEGCGCGGCGSCERCLRDEDDD